MPPEVPTGGLPTGLRAVGEDDALDALGVLGVLCGDAAVGDSGELL
jgi:hypothetical protein